MRATRIVLLCVLALITCCGVCRADEAAVVRSARSGPWSSAETWEGGKSPEPGARVLIRPGHRVVYDLDSDRPVRSIHVAGVLSFDPSRDTRLDVGLI
ncbi:MAG TPA: G8 domain-containing protein, partial [Tepidisphaeraceae bacterium]|nr:G8 domain-containing protein [Tepidisphaeraceae bacterium]